MWPPMAVQGLYPCLASSDEKRQLLMQWSSQSFQPDSPLTDLGHGSISEPITVASVGWVALIGQIWVTCPLQEPLWIKSREGN